MAIFDNRLRPIYEFIPAGVAALVAVALLVYPWAFFPVMPALETIVAMLLGCWAVWRFVQGVSVVRYQTQLRQLPRICVVVEANTDIKAQAVSGKGFQVDPGAYAAPG